MSASEKIINLPSVNIPSDSSANDAPLSQTEAFILVATILAKLNFINSKNRLDLIQGQSEMDSTMQKLAVLTNADNQKQLDDIRAQQEAQNNLSWWQKLLSYFNPVTWVMEIAKKVFKVDLAQIIAEKMKDSFSHMSAAERDIIKGVVLFASVMPGLCLIAMALNSSGLLSYQTLLSAGEDPNSTLGKIGTYLGMALDLVAKIATAIAIAVAVSVATGGAGIPAAVGGLVATVSETAAVAVTTIMEAASTILTVTELGTGLASAGLGIASGVQQLDISNSILSLAPLRALQQLMNMLIDFTKNGSQEVISRTKPFIDQINTDIKELKQMLAPFQVTAR